MKHKNGGGEISEQAEARPTAYIDGRSRVLDRAWVQSGVIANSTIAIECRVTDGAHIVDSVVSCDQVSGAYLYRCGIFDQCRVFDRPRLLYVEARDGARVYGDAVLIGRPDSTIKLHGDMRILTGHWHRAPLYKHLGFCFLTEGPPGWAMVDCKFNSLKAWFRVGERFARRWYKWTPQEVEQVRAVLMEWERTEDMRGKHFGRCVPACYSVLK